MGHLDGRVSEDKDPAKQPAGGAKDGPAGLKSGQAPKKEDAAERQPEHAPDVVHQGERRQS